MKRIRVGAAALLVAACLGTTAGTCEASANAARGWAAHGMTAPHAVEVLARVLVLARQFIVTAPLDEGASSALPITSWGQIKDKYRDPVGPIKN